MTSSKIESAKKLLASGIPVWNGSTLTFIQDRPSDTAWTYTNGNVMGGQFKYRHWTN